MVGVELWVLAFGDWSPGSLLGPDSREFEIFFAGGVFVGRDDLLLVLLEDLPELDGLVVGCQHIHVGALRAQPLDVVDLLLDVSRSKNPLDNCENNNSSYRGHSSQFEDFCRVLLKKFF